MPPCGVKGKTVTVWETVHLFTAALVGKGFCIFACNVVRVRYYFTGMDVIMFSLCFLLIIA